MNHNHQTWCNKNTMNCAVVHYNGEKCNYSESIACTCGGSTAGGLGGEGFGYVVKAPKNEEGVYSSCGGSKDCMSDTCPYHVGLRMIKQMEAKKKSISGQCFTVWDKATHTDRTVMVTFEKKDGKLEIKDIKIL